MNTEILKLLQKMKKADQPRKEESNKNPRKEESNKNPRKSNLTDKQKYLNGLMGRRK